MYAERSAKARGVDARPATGLHKSLRARITRHGELVAPCSRELFNCSLSQFLAPNGRSGTKPGVPPSRVRQRPAVSWTARDLRGPTAERPPREGEAERSVRRHQSFFQIGNLPNCKGLGGKVSKGSSRESPSRLAPKTAKVRRGLPAPLSSRQGSSFLAHSREMELGGVTVRALPRADSIN